MTHTKSTLKTNEAYFNQTIDAGDFFIHPIKKGESLRITDIEGNQAADTFFS